MTTMSDWTAEQHHAEGLRLLESAHVRGAPTANLAALATAHFAAATAINTAPVKVELRPAPTDVAWLTEG